MLLWLVLKIGFLSGWFEVMLLLFSYDLHSLVKVLMQLLRDAFPSKLFQSKICG